VVVVDHAQADDADVAVAELDQVLGRAARAAAVVDADVAAAGQARLVDHHHGHAALQRGVDLRVVLGQRVDDEGVHDRLAHGVDDVAPVRLGAGEQQQRSPAGSVWPTRPWRNSIAAGSANARLSVSAEQQADGARAGPSAGRRAAGSGPA
jgi:hypothetical protein